MAIVVVYVQHQASGVCVGLPIMEWFLQSLVFAHVEVPTAGIAHFHERHV